MTAIIASLLITILDAFKALVEALISAGYVGAGIILILFFLLLFGGVFSMALKGKTY